MPETVSMSRQGFISLLSELLGSYPNPDDASPPGPWGPVTRKALDRIRWTSGPVPAPWVRVALNPQPLPPRFAFAAAIAQEMADQVSSLQANSQAAGGTTFDDRASPANRLFQFIDDCGNGKVRRRWPWPWPPHGDQQDAALSPNELVVMGMQFEDAAFKTANEGLKRDFAKAGAKLIDLGLSRI